MSPVRPALHGAPGIAYGVEDAPPAPVALLSALQHVSLNTIWVAYPLLMAVEAGLTRAGTANLLALCMISLGMATMLQSLRAGPVGSGFLAPSGFSGIYLGPSLVALKSGGLSLVFGMTALAGQIGRAHV